MESVEPNNELVRLVEQEIEEQGAACCGRADRFRARLPEVRAALRPSCAWTPRRRAHWAELHAVEPVFVAEGEGLSPPHLWTPPSAPDTCARRVRVRCRSRWPSRGARPCAGAVGAQRRRQDGRAQGGGPGGAGGAGDSRPGLRRRAFARVGRHRNSHQSIEAAPLVAPLRPRRRWPASRESRRRRRLPRCSFDEIAHRHRAQRGRCHRARQAELRALDASATTFATTHAHRGRSRPGPRPPRRGSAASGVRHRAPASGPTGCSTGGVGSRRGTGDRGSCMGRSGGGASSRRPGPISGPKPAAPEGYMDRPV